MQWYEGACKRYRSALAWSGVQFKEINWGRGPEKYPRCICGVRDKCKIVRISRRSDRAMSFLYQRVCCEKLMNSSKPTGRTRFVGKINTQEVTYLNAETSRHSTGRQSTDMCTFLKGIVHDP